MFNTWSRYLWKCPHLVSLKLRTLLSSVLHFCFSPKDFAHRDPKRGGKIFQLISVGRWTTSLSGLSMPSRKGKKPAATILVHAMQKCCHFVLPTDAKVYVKGNQLAIFPSKII